MKNSSTYNAVLGQVALTMCHPVLNYITGKSGCNRSEIILSYLLVNYSISREQCLKLCCLRKDQSNTLSVSTKRLEDRALIEKLSIENGSEKTLMYFLTKKGTSKAKQIFLEQMKNLLTESDYVRSLFHSASGDENIEPPECAEYLYERYIKYNLNKKQVSHFLGTRDVPLAFLSNGGFSSPYLFSCNHEVTFDRYGHPVSIYQKLYQGQNIHKGEVRSDSVLSFHIGTAGSDTLNMYIEHDTGSQTSSILKDKISQYASLVFSPLLEGRPALVPYLVFSIADRVDAKDIVTPERLEFKTRERYLAQGLSLAAGVYLAYNDVYGVSLYELRTFLETAPLSSRDKDSFLPFLDSCIKEIGGDKNAIDIVEKLYDSLKYGNEDKDKLYTQRCERYYGSRRDLLFKSMDDIPEIEKLFLKGFSVCAVSTRQSAAARTFLPECCGMSACLTRNLSSGSQPSRVAKLLSLARFSCGGEEVALRNVYTLSDGRNIAVENIGDDYGAYTRVKYLLKCGYSPCDVLCLVAPYDLDRTKELFRQYRYSASLSRFYVMSYMYRQEEYEGERERVCTYDSIILPGVVAAKDFI